MKRIRYEVEPRPENLGGGWRLRLIGLNENTGNEEEYGGGIFPVEPNVDSNESYTDALQTGIDWLGEAETLEDAQAKID